jgi:lipoic acid synthetase
MTSGSRGNRLPSWFKVRLTTGRCFVKVQNRLRESDLNTVCESAACPNRNECWNAGTATFLILGERCTRACRFCNIPSGEPSSIDQSEPRRVAEAVSALGLCYAVVTSVTRDDLPDGGSALFAETIRQIRSRVPACRVEVLVPDFLGKESALLSVLDAAPDVLNHNIETVPSLYPQVRPRADYRRSLQLLERATSRGFATKSGLMLGLGEDRQQVRSVMKDLRGTGCSILTLGQYLRPGRKNLPVERFYAPEEFEMFRAEAAAFGFATVMAGPLVRSSYRAADGMAPEHKNEIKETASGKP